jgi:hypothetical protein
MARKVDQTLRVMVNGAWSGEVAIFESKPVVSDATCERQHKSIRLNTAILTNLESHGLDISRWYPIIAETRAASADFYTIKKYEDVLGVGRATTRKCWIPTHSCQLKGFLRSRTIEALLGFRLSILAVAVWIACLSLNVNAFPDLCERGHSGSLGKSTVSISPDATIAAHAYHAVQGINVCTFDL